MSQQPTPDEAIGLTYDGEQAPHIACHLRGEDVTRFLAMAEEAGVYVHHDPVLLERLAALPEGESIPPALYVIIAEILAWSWTLQGRFPSHWRRPDGTKAIEEKV